MPDSTAELGGFRELGYSSSYKGGWVVGSMEGGWLCLMSMKETEATILNPSKKRLIYPKCNGESTNGFKRDVMKRWKDCFS